MSAPTPGNVALPPALYPDLHPAKAAEATDRAPSVDEASAPRSDTSGSDQSDSRSPMALTKVEQFIVDQLHPTTGHYTTDIGVLVRIIDRLTNNRIDPAETEASPADGWTDRGLPDWLPDYLTKAVDQQMLTVAEINDALDQAAAEHGHPLSESVVIKTWMRLLSGARHAATVGDDAPVRPS